ncbi:CotH kinase family protein [[Clostridium] aminophilum]|nr:FN3 associated domain-containing protein [[Clostridium] aminophilum]
MEKIILILLVAHLVSIIIMELVIYSFPFQNQKDWKRSLTIGTPVNILFNFLLFFISFNVFFSDGLFLTIKNLLTLKCSYQDITRLSTSCLVSVTISTVISGAAYQYVKKHCDTAKKFRYRSPLLFLFMITLIPIMIGYQLSRTGADFISINEVCRKTIAKPNFGDRDGDNDVSYVVIKNDGELAFDADKLFLSANGDDLRYIRVSGGRIHSGDTYTCLMEDDEGMDIKKKGGTIVYLSDVEGKILDSIVVPALARDESYQKNSDGWAVVRLSEEVSELLEAAAPVFSADSGFYESDFYLSLSAEEGETIYYTLDCSDPTVESDCYSQPIHVYDKSSEPNIFRSIQNVQEEYKQKEEIGKDPVDKAFVVRAMAVDKEGNQSKTITKTFWVDLEKYKDKTVISLVTDPRNLFDEENGIYVNGQQYEEWYNQSLEEDMQPDEKEIKTDGPIPNYMQRGEEWERIANFEIINDSGVMLNQPVGIRIQGASTRARGLKRFSIYSRKKYSGSKWFDSPVINDKPNHSFVLREGFKNAFVPSLVEDRDVGIQHGMPVEVFLDGEYWYSVYLLEKYSDSYFHEYYQLNSDNIQLVKNKTDPNLLRIIDAGYSSDEEAYSQINSVMDIQSYIDYICINAYVDNEDMYEQWNCLTWKSGVKEDAEYGDTRWRWLLYDLDLGWNSRLRDHTSNDIPWQVNTFTLGPAIGRKADPTMINQPLYKGLRKNSIFCRNLVLTFMDIVNTDFRKEHVQQKLEEFGNTSPKITDFFTYRSEYIVPYMAEEFELKGSQETVTLTSNRTGRPIKLNTIQPEIQDEWSGTYFTDYPVTVIATDEGFDHWEITANEITTKYYDETLDVPIVKGGVKINAIFQ